MQGLTKDNLHDLIEKNIPVDSVHEKVMGHLISKVYEYICVIDCKRNMIFVDYDNLGASWNWTGEEHSYDEARNSLKPLIIAEDWDRYYTKSAIPNLQKNLEEADSYVYTIRIRDKRGNKQIKSLQYSYIDKDAGLILTTLEDTTSLLYLDPLTGESNRKGFIQKVESILDTFGNKEDYAILYFNIRGFKSVNKLFGVDGGDEVLKAIPRLLKESSLDPVALGRMGTDHFACLVRGECIEKTNLAELLRHTYNVDNRSLEIRALCGIYYIKDAANTSVSEMCDSAKMALNKIVDESTTPYAVFDENMQASYMKRTEVLNDLKHALKNNEFVVFYQPVYDLKTREIASAEALVRWRRSDGEMVSPGVFVPALEESGHISQVDLYVERSVIDFMENRQKENKHVVPVSINMSQMDFYDKDMMASVLLDISNTTMPLDFTRFEVTETAYCIVAENNRNAILDMKKIGIKFYLDDFGSGYSSFSTIRDYDFDVIKLDMGFIKKIGTSEKANGVVRSIIDMAHSIGSKVVAEGVETEEQLWFLEMCQCDYIQGYYFSKPLPEEEFAELLDRHA